jgi:hypothetical protein
MGRRGMDMKRIKKWKEGGKEDVKLELKTEVECKRLASLLVSNGRLMQESARHRPTSEETEDKGQSGMCFKRLPDLLDIIEDALFADVTLSIM